MELETKRLIIRDFKKGDETEIFENISNPKVIQFIGSIPFPYTLKNAEEFVTNQVEEEKKNPRNNYDFAITLKGEDKVIGGIAIKGISYFNLRGEIGYWLGEKYWRKGIMTEALKELLEFIFKELKLNRVDIDPIADNVASNELIKKLGFNHEGVRKQYRKSRVTEKFYDSNQYGLLREDWLKSNSK
ncbi:MAG: GNAT family protein [archaeon]